MLFHLYCIKLNLPFRNSMEILLIKKHKNVVLKNLIMVSIIYCVKNVTTVVLL